MLWFAALALIALSVLLILAPIWRQGVSEVDHTDGALAIFADQIAEVDREAKQGVISSDDAEAAKTEIKRRMLAVSRGRGASRAANVGGGAMALGVVALLAPLLAGVVYWQVGNPDVPSVPFAERQVERAQDMRVEELVGQLRARLLEDPNGGETEGWVLLGQTLMRLERFPEAASAFERVVERDDVSSSALTQYAEAVIVTEGGVVPRRALIAIERARAMNTGNPAAEFYWAQFLAQEGRLEEAEQVLSDRLAQESTPQGWMEVFVLQINGLRQERGAAPLGLNALLGTAGSDDVADGPVAPGPTREDVEAASEMTTEDRAAMINGMVEGLAARLAEDPNDLDGWLRLARAYGVLGRDEDALSAYQSAEDLLEGLAADDPRRDVVAQGLAAQ